MYTRAFENIKILERYLSLYLAVHQLPGYRTKVESRVRAVIGKMEDSHNALGRLIIFGKRFVTGQMNG